MRPNRTALRAAEVAQLFDVSPKTVTRWAVAGKLPSFRTLGGHRRYDARQIRALLVDAGLAWRVDELLGKEEVEA